MLSLVWLSSYLWAFFDETGPGLVRRKVTRIVSLRQTESAASASRTSCERSGRGLLLRKRKKNVGHMKRLQQPGRQPPRLL